MARIRYNVLNAPGVVPGRYDIEATRANMEPADSTRPDMDMIMLFQKMP